jgi:hypothetical protein
LTLEASWVHIFNPGLEKVELEVSELGVMATGEVEERIGDSSCRFHYTLLCDPSWNVKELIVDRHTPKTGSVDLMSDGLGEWYNAACEEIPVLDGCTEVDLSASAFTNTIPIRRLDLAANQKAELKVAHVDAYSLEIRVSQQRYTCLQRGESESTYYYEGLATGTRVQIQVDANGLILDYPGMFRRTDIKG